MTQGNEIDAVIDLIKANPLPADIPGLRAAFDAGVSVTFEEWPGMIHVWHLYAPMLAEGRQTIARIGEYAKQQWAA